MISKNSLKKTSLIVLPLSLFLCLASPQYGYCATTTATSQSITIPINQWQTLKSELILLNQELTSCQKELLTLKKPSAELLIELNQAQSMLTKLQQELTESKNELTMLSKEVDESKTLLQTLKTQINRERKIHNRQIWQSRFWCILIGAGIGFAVK